MASCGGGGGDCRLSCHRTDEEESTPRLALASAEEGTRENLGSFSIGDRGLCSKCGLEKPVWNSLCLNCFRSSLYGKFKLAVTSNAMISPADKVLVAFSGGSASRVALQFIHEMQCKLLKNWDASKSQGLAVFGVGVTLIDESIFSMSPSIDMAKAFEEISKIVSELTPRKELHIAPIESICSENFDSGRRRLSDLLDSISDPTGKEDFIHCLRMLLLQKIALDNKYTKLLLGSCTSKMARLIISSTVKGQGYSLPADLQYVDSRWQVPIVLPLRDCLAHELSMICHFDGLKTVPLFNQPSVGINGLVSSFIARLQDENPSRERTIVRTADKLKPFSFNKFTEDGYYDSLPAVARSKFQTLNHMESDSEILCPICRSPLSSSDWKNVLGLQANHHAKAETFVSQCCQSCRFQILPKERGSLEHFYSFLPSSMTDMTTEKTGASRRWLREQIEEFLISGDENGT
ncbi:Cytoplasmic tRNA 2-thiolation protein 2 [Apostasia shenzhenica]|uniref:Cytoplasmic tRNA 2-thiolation protein 2 n=1 Tax=Apostasia shenzhenica TaxID=1088818 RepID=A0A2I0AFG1_9ASPA|nr:Cytoplasmic tRNA 2-thiolation protein 2 [Apostasia shenzhenica]